MVEEDSQDEADESQNKVANSDTRDIKTCDTGDKNLDDELKESNKSSKQLSKESSEDTEKNVEKDEGDADDFENLPGASDERGAGDGQEETAVDDDEDRRNPQYIPKRGVFYEHDDREEDEVNDQEVKEGEETEVVEKRPGKQKVWRSEQTEKWGHDKFLELEQEPKTKDELVAAYGYDIRNEDNAPRARRRRRYGRGPNKYTRKWEDEEAYTPGTGGKGSERGRGGGRGGGMGRGNRSPKVDDDDEFPSLDNKRASNVTESPRDDGRKKGGSDKNDRNERSEPRGMDSSKRRGGAVSNNNRNNTISNNRNKNLEQQDRISNSRGASNSGYRMSNRGSGRGSINNANRNIKSNNTGDRGSGYSRVTAVSNNQSDTRPPAPFPNTNAKKLVDQVVDTKLDMIDKNMSNLKIKIDNSPNTHNSSSPKNQSQRNREVTNTSSPKMAMSPHQSHTRSTNQSNHAKDGSGYDESGDSRPKRYSSLRQPRGNSNRGHQNNAGEGDDYQQNVPYQDQYSQEPRDQQQNFGSPVTVPTPLNTAGTTFSFPSNGSGPPPNAPFLPVAGGHGNTVAAANQAVAAQLAAVAGNSSYIPPPPGLAGFAAGPHPPGVPGSAVQYGGVPVTVGSLSALVGAHSSADLAVLAAATNPHLHPHQTVASAEQVMAIAAAGANAASGNQGYAEIRGGVTYFNPNAQPTVMSRPPVNKRPKAAIPIVDPSQIIMSNEKDGSTEMLSQQNSLDSSDQGLLSGPSLSNNGSQDMKVLDGGESSATNNLEVSDIKSKPLTAV